MQVGSSSPFPLSQHNPSPRYHPHSQREDHGDVEYDEDVRDGSAESQQQVHMPYRGEKKRERPEIEERDQPTHPHEESEDQRQGALEKSEGEKELPEESFSSPRGQPAEDAERTESRTGNLNDEAEVNRERDGIPEEGDQKKQDQIKSENNQVEEQREGPTSQEQSESQPTDRQDDKSSETREQQRDVRQEQSVSAAPDQQDDVQRQSPTQTPTSNEESTAKDTPPDIEGTLKDSEEGDKESDKGWTRVEHDEGSTSNRDQNEEHFTKPTMSLAEQIYHSELPKEPEGGDSTTQASAANQFDDTQTSSSPFPNLKEEPARDRVSEKSVEATNQSHRNLVPTDESFCTPMRQDEKPKHKDDHQHAFLAQAHNDYGKKPHYHDELNQPNPRAEHPPMQAYANPVSVDMGLRRQEGGGEMNVFQTEDRRRVHHQGDALPPNDVQRAQWDMNQHQSHHLHQQDLQQKQQHLAHVSMIGMASVTIEAQHNEGSGENIDFDLERERLARLQSETARLHGGVIPKDSDVSLAQSEIEKRQRRQQEEFNREIEVEQVIVPVVYEGTYVVPVDTQERDANEEESKRLHNIHDNIVQEIKTGAYVDAFDKK